jgi:hypothetical protein
MAIGRLIPDQVGDKLCLAVFTLAYRVLSSPVSVRFRRDLSGGRFGQRMENTKFEVRNTKQIQNSNVPISKHGMVFHSFLRYGFC